MDHRASRKFAKQLQAVSYSSRHFCRAYYTKTFCLLTTELCFERRNASDIATNKEGIANNKREIDLLKQISTELDVKSQEDEKRVSDLNVTIENLNMNFSLY